MKDKMMKTKRNEIFVGLNRNWIYSKASKMRRLRYLFCIFLTLSLLTDLAYSFSEYGTCRFFITGFKGDANGFRTGRRTISWRYQGKVVGAGNTLNFMDETNGGEKDTYAYNKEYGDILLLELIDGKATKSFAVNLTKTSSKNPSTPYLQFEKRSILDKGVKKNIMVVHIMMVQTLNEGTEPLPVTYKIDGGSCEITYKNEDKTIHERIDVIANEPPTHGNNPKFNDYIIPKYVPLPTDAKTEFIMPQKPNGVCFFDVDGTLSQNDENTNDVVVKNCLDKDFSVGIITSSQRTIDYLCEEYFISENLCKLIKNNNMFNSLVMRSGKKYTVPKFEEFLNPERKKKPDANFKLGNLKALHAHNWRYVNYKDMPDKCVLLIDDDVETLYGYLFYGIKKIAVLMPNAVGMEADRRPEDVDQEKHQFSFFHTYVDEPDASDEEESNKLIVPKEFAGQELKVQGLPFLSPANVGNIVSQLVARGCDKEITPTTSKPSGTFETKDPDKQ